MTADSNLTVTIRRARDAAEVDAGLRLRVRVFCEEQGVSREEELDRLDDEALQIVALDESGVIATCRLRILQMRPGMPGREAEDMPECKLERMAVDGRVRGLGVGAKLLEGAEDEARAAGAATMVLHAQLRAERFYASHGYVAVGEAFTDAGIEHVAMRKAL